MEENLDIERHGSIATIWMNRPEHHNAFDEHLIADLTHAARALDADTSVRVVILAGRGKSFSTGGDLDWMRRAAAYSVEQNLEDARGLAAMLRTIAELSKPTIARVHGAAYAGGMGLVTACDIAVASTTAVFCASEVKVGLIPATISPYVVSAIGARQARRYFMTAETISAQLAAAIGLVHKVVEPDQLDTRIAEIAAALCASGPQAQAAAKRLVNAVDGKTIDDALVEYTARSIADIRATDEAREGIAAFLNKRPPSWKRDA